MGKLAERLGDPARSGVYRVEVTEALEEAAGIAGLPIVRAGLRATAESRLLDACSQAVARRGFPGWAAFSAALAEPAPAGQRGQVVLVDGFEALLDEHVAPLAPLFEALESAAASHRQQGRHFFAVFLDPGRRLALNPLYDRRRHAPSAVPAHAVEDTGGDS
jgi:hypothetical protein